MDLMGSEIGHTACMMRHRQVAPRPPVRVQPEGGEAGNPWPTQQPTSDRNLVIKRIQLRRNSLRAQPPQSR